MAGAVFTASASAQIEIQQVDLTHETGPIRGFLATVDLADPRVEVVVTAPLEQPTDDNASPEARLIPTDEWATREAVTLAVNANFFGVLDAGGADVIGLSVSDGRVVSPVRSYDGQTDWSFAMLRDGGAVITNDPKPDRIENAVSGVGPSASVPDLGGPLIHNGRNVADRARVAPLVRHPRTAAGIDDQGRHLIIAVIDGRQPDWSIGITLPELADLMLRHGAEHAINLDGGGSSSFVYHDAQRTITNRPSDGEFRPVANHLGIRLEPSATHDSQ